jgi:hypothetical protein
MGKKRIKSVYEWAAERSNPKIKKLNKEAMDAEAYAIDQASAYRQIFSAAGMTLGKIKNKFKGK